MKSPSVDFHIHSQYSHGEGSIQDIVKTGIVKNLTCLAITEHVRCQSSWFESFLSDIEAMKKQKGIKVISGIESKVLDFCGRLDATERMISAVDLVVASVHRIPSFHDMRGNYIIQKVNQDKTSIASLYLRALRGIASNPAVDVVGHPFHLLKAMAIEGISKDDKMETARLFSKSRKAVEINSFYHVPDLEFLRMCVKEGVSLSVGSDAHRLIDVGNVNWSMRVLRKAGGTSCDIIDVENVIANKKH